MTSLTSANAVLLLTIDGVYSSPQQLQRFATDDIFDVDAVQSAETAMGVDGYLSAGFVWNEKVQRITLQADSPSNTIFETWNSAMESSQEVFACSGSITLKSVNRKFTMIRGILTSYAPIPSGKKILQPRTYAITWQKISPAPMGA